MTKERILIVEDELKIANILRDYLSNAGYGVSHLGDGERALEEIQRIKPSCVILDLMLPGKDGLSICKEVRQFSDVPIVMITARVDEIDRLLGLELGADDYICKPFSPREVVVRIRNILRRVSGSSGKESREETSSLSELNYRDLYLNSDRLTCTLKQQSLVLTAVEFRMLHALAKHPGKIFGRQKLMDVAYDDRRIVSDRTIDTHIKNLRKKLSDVASDELIHSIYGVGYKLE